MGPLAPYGYIYIYIYVFVYVFVYGCFPFVHTQNPSMQNHRRIDGTTRHSRSLHNQSHHETEKHNLWLLNSYTRVKNKSPFVKKCVKAEVDTNHETYTYIVFVYNLLLQGQAQSVRYPHNQFEVVPNISTQPLRSNSCTYVSTNQHRNQPPNKQPFVIDATARALTLRGAV